MKKQIMMMLVTLMVSMSTVFGFTHKDYEKQIKIWANNNVWFEYDNWCITEGNTFRLRYLAMDAEYVQHLKEVTLACPETSEIRRVCDTMLYLAEQFQASYQKLIDTRYNDSTARATYYRYAKAIDYLATADNTTTIIYAAADVDKSHGIEY